MFKNLENVEFKYLRNNTNVDNLRLSTIDLVYNYYWNDLVRVRHDYYIRPLEYISHPYTDFSSF